MLCSICSLTREAVFCCLIPEAFISRRLLRRFIYFCSTCHPKTAGGLWYPNEWFHACSILGPWLACGMWNAFHAWLTFATCYYCPCCNAWFLLMVVTSVAWDAHSTEIWFQGCSENRMPEAQISLVLAQSSPHSIGQSKTQGNHSFNGRELSSTCPVSRGAKKIRPHCYHSDTSLVKRISRLAPRLVRLKLYFVVPASCLGSGSSPGRLLPRQPPACGLGEQ